MLTHKIMTNLPVNASKAQEIEHYSDFLATLPEGSYLHSMFGGTLGAVRMEIHDDMAIGPVADVCKARDNARKECLIWEAKRKEAEKDLEAVKLDIASLEKRKEAVQNELRNLKERAERILRA